MSHNIAQIFNAAYDYGGAKLLDYLQSSIGLIEHDGWFILIDWREIRGEVSRTQYCCGWFWQERGLFGLAPWTSSGSAQSSHWGKLLACASTSISKVQEGWNWAELHKKSVTFVCFFSINRLSRDFLVVEERFSGRCLCRGFRSGRVLDRAEDNFSCLFILHLICNIDSIVKSDCWRLKLLGRSASDPFFIVVCGPLSVRGYVSALENTVDGGSSWIFWRKIF